MSNIKSSGGNPFVAHAKQIEKSGQITITRPATKPAQALRKIRAQLNFVPDDFQLSTLIDRALELVRAGRVLDRGAVLNLLV